MCLAARQLLTLVGAVPKWTNVWLVLEAGDGSRASPYYGKVINCASGGAEPSQGGKFCKDWWAFRGGKDGRRRETNSAAAGKDGCDNQSNEDRADGGPGGGNETRRTKDGDDEGASDDGRGSGGAAGDAESSGSADYPEQTMLTRSIVKTIGGGTMGKKSLSPEDLRKVLYLGGLEDMNEITYGDVEEMFIKAGTVLRARFEKSAFSWARLCPLSLLANTWSSPGVNDSVDGTDFVPPNHRSAKGQSMLKKRLVICVAAHLSPFYAKVFSRYFAAARLSGVKKRFRPKDPFADSKTRARKARKKSTVSGDARKLTKAEQFAASAQARLRVEVAKRNARTARNHAATAQAAASRLDEIALADAAAAAIKEAAAITAAREKAAADAGARAGSTPAGDCGRGSGPMCPMATMPLCALERSSTQLRMHAVWTREPTTLLPGTTTVSVVTLCGKALSDAARASLSVRVVLPRVLLTKAFAALAAAKSSAPTPTADARTSSELAVQLTLGSYDPVVAFSTTLMQMSSVLALNETIASARNLASWLGGFVLSDAVLPAQLNFLSGQTMHVAAMAESVRAGISCRLVGDCVWKTGRVGRLLINTKVSNGAFGGCSVGVQDMCDAGQQAFLTNALVDAGLAELQQRCAAASVPTAVLSCTQSAAFTSIAGAEVPLPRAMASIVEVLDTWEPSIDRYVMLVNIGNSHWVSACVSFLTRSVTLYDSIGGPSPAKSLIVSRLLLFARQADLRRLVLVPQADDKEVMWTVADEVNQPAQQDGYNCGLFAFAHIWCHVHGQDLASLPVVGDHLRLSFLHFILKSGVARAAEQMGSQAAAG